MSIAGLRGPERSDPGQPGVLPGSSDAGDVRLVTPGSCGLLGVSAGLVKALSNGFGSFDRCVPLGCALKYSLSPF